MQIPLSVRTIAMGSQSSSRCGVVDSPACAPTGSEKPTSSPTLPPPPPRHDSFPPPVPIVNKTSQQFLKHIKHLLYFAVTNGYRYNIRD